MINKLIILFAVLCFGNTAHAALFNQGDTATLCTSLSYIGTTSYMDATYITFPLGGYPIVPGNGTITAPPVLNAGDSFRMNLYTNRSDATPYFSSIMSGPDNGGWHFIFTRPMMGGPIIGDPSSSVTFGPLLWENLDGKITLTMLSGSMRLDSLNVQVYTGGQVWANTLAVTDVTPTPILGVAWLMGSGLMSLVGLRRRRLPIL